MKREVSCENELEPRAQKEDLFLQLCQLLKIHKCSLHGRDRYAHFCPRKSIEPISKRVKIRFIKCRYFLASKLNGFIGLNAVGHICVVRKRL
jgi:hypothetical protein